MRKVFNDPELQQKFDKDGYISLPFISADKVERLKELFFETLPKSGGQITAGDITTVETDSSTLTYDFTFIDKNPDYKRLVFDLITKEFAESATKYLHNYKPIIANYIRKRVDTGEVPVHQNWAFADERKVSTVSIWCPLVDSTRENGTLEVIPGSHKRFAELRGPMIPWELEGIKNELVDKYMVPINTKAGDCVILDDSIVHYTRPNRTPNLRLAIQLILIPEEAPSIHYHLDHNQPNEVKVWEVDHDFYMEFNPWMKPENVKTVSTRPYKPKSLSVQEFDAGLKAPRFDEEPGGIFNKIKKLFLQEA